MEIINNLEYMSISNDTYMNTNTSTNTTNNIITQMEIFSITDKLEPILEENEMETTMENGMESHTANYIDENTTMEIIEHHLFNNNLDIYDSCYDNIRLKWLGIPNIHCKSFDDEDFVYTRFDFPKKIKHILHHRQSIEEYLATFITKNKININYEETIASNIIIYAKILYIYQYAYNYYTNLSYLAPCDRIVGFPIELINWVDNIIIMIKYAIGFDVIESIKKINLDDNDNCNDNGNDNGNEYGYNDNSITSIFYNSIKDEYNKELVYGLNIILCNLKIIINHCIINSLELSDLDSIYLEKFFRCLNNLCVVVMFLQIE